MRWNKMIMKHCFCLTSNLPRARLVWLAATSSDKAHNCCRLEAIASKLLIPCQTVQVNI